MAALRDLVTTVRGSDLDVDLQVDLPDTVPGTVSTTVYRVVQEGLTNVVRHSRATRCAVELGPGSIVVTDDGRGVRGRGEGNGVRGLRERVEQAGGRLHLGTGPDGTGTRLEVQL